MITVATAKSGAPYAAIGNNRIHSSYDPQKEAARFFDHETNKTPSLVVILGPGLGYLINEAKQRFPNAKILSVFYSSFFYSYFTGNVGEDGPQYTWHPGSPQPLRVFFDFHISDLDVEGIKIFEWPPSAAAFSNLSEEANRTLNQVIRERNGSLVTTFTFGKRWLTNALYNFLFIDHIQPLRKSNKPTIIAASGPSLSQGIDLIDTYRERVNVWALPSSLKALDYNNIRPDAIIVTDPGFYSTLHFYPFFCKRKPLLIMPLTASRGLVPQFSKVSLFSQSFFAEDILLRHAHVPIESFPSLGTVAATAIEIALRTTKTAPIFVTGLDLCKDDIKTHVTPHAFDDLFLAMQERLHTMRTIFFDRMYKSLSAGSDSLPLKTYAGWFSRQKQHYRGRLYRLFPSEQPIDSMVSCSRDDFIAIMNSLSAETYETGTVNQTRQTNKQSFLPERKKRLTIIKKTLGSWMSLLSWQLRSEGAPLSIDDLQKEKTVFNLIYYFSLQELIELKRDFRLYSHDRIEEVFIRMCKKTEDFLHHLYERISMV